MALRPWRGAWRVVGPGMVGDPSAAHAVAALERQARSLLALRQRMTATMATAPTVVEDDWRGPARRLYDLGLGDLHRLLGVAALTIDEAIAETRRAIETMTARVG